MDWNSRCATRTGSSLTGSLVVQRAWLKATWPMSYCKCYTENRQTCGTAASVGDERCCVVSQSSDPRTAPKNAYCFSCMSVQTTPTKKAKRLCLCSSEKKQSFGGDNAIPDDRRCQTANPGADPVARAILMTQGGWNLQVCIFMI